MQKISLKKRILCYVLLCLLTLMVPETFGRALSEYSPVYGIIFILFPHYLVGVLFFLKAKWIIKLILPFVIAIISFGSFLLLVEIGFFDIINSDNFEYFTVFILLAFVWEIAYQILIRCLKRTEKLEENPI